MANKGIPIDEFSGARATNELHEAIKDFVQSSDRKTKSNDHADISDSDSHNRNGARTNRPDLFADEGYCIHRQTLDRRFY